MSQRMLITGASGFLGGIIADALKHDFQTSITYNTTPLQLDGCQALQLDFCQPETVTYVLENAQPDIVVHCAAQASGAVCQMKPELAEQINVNGTRMLLESLSSTDCFFIHISTDLIFDGNKAFSTENDTPNPVSIYGQTKLRAEQAVQELSKNYVILRPALMYGPVSPTGKGSFVQWMDHAFREEERVNLFEDEYRTPLYAPDVAKAIKRLTEIKPKHRIFNFGGPERITRVQFGHILAKICGHDESKINPTRLTDLDTGYPRPTDVSMDSTRIQKELGIELTSVEEGLKPIFQ